MSWKVSKVLGYSADEAKIIAGILLEMPVLS